jgi:DNA-binding MarR family transcriptional regulator
VNDASQLIARWENLTRMLYSWTAPTPVEAAEHELLAAMGHTDGTSVEYAACLADRLGFDRRGMGAKLAGLRRRGLIDRRHFSELRLYGWFITDTGRAALSASRRSGDAE